MNLKTLVFYSICVIIPSVICAQIVNEGILQIQPSTLVYFQNAYINRGTHKNDGDLYFNSNFENNGITSSASGTTFFKSSNNDILTISGTKDSIQFNNLEINVFGPSKKGVFVTNNIGLIVQNKLNLVSGNLRLAGESQLVQKHLLGTINTATTGSLSRDQQGISTTTGYNYWSSPVNNNAGSFSLNAGLYDGTDTDLNPFSPQPISFNYGSPYNGAPAILDVSNNVATALKINDRWLFIFPKSNLEYDGWQQINSNTALSPGTGFTMKGTGMASQNYVFKGIPNDGEYTFPISAGESMLIGNPYPSALDSHKFINDNLLAIGEIYLWVDGGTTSHYLANYLGGYAVRNLFGGTPPSVIPSIAGLGLSSTIIPERYVAVGQGFFVKHTNGGTITFNNSQRVFQKETAGNSIFYKTSNPKKNNASKADELKIIRIGYEDPEKFHRQLLLGFIPNSPANLNANIGYDSVMLDPREDEVFFMIENDLTKKYVIQGVGDYDNLYEFPIGFSITQQGNHVMMLDAVENFTDTVYIKDKLLNTTYNLSEVGFSVNLPPGNYFDRFSIVFTKSALNISDVFVESNFRVYYKNNNIFINRNNLQLNHVTIFTELGQKILELDAKNLKEQSITIPFKQQKGLYIITLESNQHRKSLKIIN